MNVIYKYPFPVAERALLHLAGLIRPLHVDSQNKESGELQVWAEINDSDITAYDLILYVVGTGLDIPPDAKYLNTVMDGRFVWHIYYRIVGATKKEGE